MKKPRRRVPVKKPQRQHAVSAQAPVGPKRRRRSVSATGTLKPVAPAKVTAQGKVTATGKIRQWSPGADVACCSAEALGLLLGWDHGRVLDLYWRTCSDPDEGATIADTLAAVPACAPAVRWLAVPTLCGNARMTGYPGGGGGLILGVSLPEPHAVAVTPDGRWWSWGEPFDPAAWPGLVIDEAWAVIL
jgi:hypothetical protein